MHTYSHLTLEDLLEQLAGSLLTKIRAEPQRNGSRHGYGLWGWQGGEVLEIKTGWSGYVEREGFGKGWGIWERPDWLSASLALPAALGRVLRAAREREQPHL